jgi:para-nitrobenzyl esterase
MSAERNLCRPLFVLAATLSGLGIGLAGCGGDDEVRRPADETRRTISQGEVVGYLAENGAHAWRGLPFAEPPVGDLRWRAPRPPAGWSGVREALASGSECVQFGGPLSDSGSGKPTGDEDCLGLNVFAPAMTPEQVARLDQPLPVMVWIHGGGNTIGSATVYDGSVLAASQSVIVVTVNYRLGVFGWFSHPALHERDESADDRSGNYGTLDLVRALSWVRDEIAAFGGDPTRVTIFGESAGGANVYSLLLSPRAKGLFQRGIVQSGGIWTSTVDEARNPRDAASPGHPMSSAEVSYALAERSLGAKGRDAARAQVDEMTTMQLERLLRGAAAADVLELFDGSRMGGMYDNVGLIRDGTVLPPGDPLVALAAGRYNRVPVIIGSNRDEVRLFAMMGSDHVTRVFGMPLWPKDERRWLLETEYPSLMWKAQGVDEPASAMADAQGDSVFAYRFDWDEEPKLLCSDFSILLGAAHAVEIPFVFGRLRFLGLEFLLFDDDRRPAAEELARSMMSYWGQFAWLGRPGHGSNGRLPLWRPWDDSTPDAPRFLILDTADGGGIRMSSDSVTREGVIERVSRDDRFQSADERCEIYRSFVERGESMKRSEYERVGDGECAALPPGD